ncbi:MAG: recombinase family protein [Clostridiales bacterium]|nr:recombinase family protein [Clostridiales bacterium]
MEKNVSMDGTGAMAVRSPVIETAAGNTVIVARQPGKNVRVLKREREPMPTTERVSNAEPKRVAAYCRISTDKEEQESSLQAQMESFRRQIEERPGWTLVDIYVDEGITGTQAKRRDAFNRMIADCEAGKIDYIITKSISRFARNTLECLSYIRQLKSCGVYVLFEKEHMDTGNEASEMVLSILAAIAQEESRNISENIKWNQRKRYKEGRAVWRETYGYKKEGDRAFVVDEKTAPVVRRIFNEYIHGRRAAEIARSLEAEEIPGPKGNHWKYASVDFILTNEKYCGDARCQKSYVENHLTHRRCRNNQTVVPGYYIQNHHTPIVDREVFNLAQTIRTLRSRKGHPVQYPYGGRITCPVCGQKMERIVLERTGSPAVWHCAPASGMVLCAGNYVDEKYIDAALRQAYAELSMEALEKQAGRRNQGVAQAARDAIRMKQELPELGEVHYYYLEVMVREITFQKWDTMVVWWKCGLKTAVSIAYRVGYDVPGSKMQRSTLVSKRWVEEAEKAAAEKAAEAEGENP